MMKYAIPAGYLIAATLWIIFSDSLVDTLIPGNHVKLIINSGKGLIFVLITATVLFLLLRRYTAHQETMLTRLGEQEQGFRHLFTSNPQPMWIYHRKTLRFLEVNHVAIQKYGYTHDEFLRLTIADIRPAEDVGRLMSEIEKTSSQPIASGEWRHRLKSGVVIDVEVVRHEIVYNGQPAAMITVSDITAKKQVQRELQEVEARLENVLNSVEEAIRIIDPNTYEVLYISPGVEKIYGHPPEAYYQDRELLVKGIHPDDRGWVLQKRAERPQTGGWDIEFRIIQPDGQTRWIHDRSRVICDDTGKPVRIEGFAVDITEKKRVQEEQQKNQALQQALAHEAELSHLRHRFTSMMSHEFRSPLATMFSSMEILERYYDRLTPEKRAGHILKAKTHIKRMVGLLDDILALMYAENIGQAMTCGQVDMAGLLRTMTDEMQPRLLPVQSFALTLPEELVAFHGDEKLLRQAVENLLANAIKYSPGGGEIGVRLTRHPGEIQVAICDQGIGIPPGDIPALFAVFQRASNVGSIPGTGLGLAMVKEVVQRHNGHIEVSSETGKGTTFTLHLPLALSAC